MTKFDKSGIKQWVKQRDYIHESALAADPNGGIYLANAANGNASIVKYDKQGQELWVKTTNGGCISSIAADLYGNTFVTGSLREKELHFDGHVIYNLDSTDFFVAKLDMFAVNVSAITNEQSLMVYPNPSDGNFRIKGKDLNADCRIEVFNTLGQIVYSSSTTDPIVHLNMPTGMYLLKISDRDRSEITIVRVQQ